MRRLISLALTMALGLVALLPEDALAVQHSAARKAGRGLAAITCGFLEIPGGIVRETKKQGGVGVPVGLAVGLGRFVARELVGVYELVTAPFPAPPGFKPILEPEFPWGHFE